MKILTIDIGGTNIKVKVNNDIERRKIPSGNYMTPEMMVSLVIESTNDWEYEVISIGFPGVIKKGKIVVEPKNLGEGWLGYDFEKAFGKPVKLINDAAMQALGSYQGDTMLFLGLGTGLGSALVAEGTVVPMELAHLSYRKGTFEDYLGLRGLERLGLEKWQQHVLVVVGRFKNAFLPDDIVLGGGKSKLLTDIPEGCRLGTNNNAYLGGFRLWDEHYHLG
ncbi:polyphosphate glucokinase [Aquiflexum balticum DSM 16537]|uniref:Polyphosphate glucokinase n=1 Tax=Aquiflexum balticum DSM 16537 TaxID=758820 RepID=A0A1W2H9S6_9BACT|nr:ROK family protein [Aquiflexum balticum]SMD45448.1 polyphosphate glucokinase [Aquiflexum balticum DSM 16537]